MSDGTRKKSAQLGMPFGTACNKLRKKILFDFVRGLGLDICFRCGEQILTVHELSIEHKKPWLDVSPDLFWDLNNIAYSHLSCNSGSGRGYNRKVPEHGTRIRYMNHGCRCEPCKKAASEHRQRYRKKNAAVAKPA